MLLLFPCFGHCQFDIVDDKKGPVILILLKCHPSVCALDNNTYVKQRKNSHCPLIKISVVIFGHFSINRWYVSKGDFVLQVHGFELRHTKKLRLKPMYPFIGIMCVFVYKERMDD